MTRAEMLNELAASYGYSDIWGAMENEPWAYDSIVPGICPCGFVRDSMEPDARNYSCDEGCGNTVNSVLVLLGII